MVAQGDEGLSPLPIGYSLEVVVEVRRHTLGNKSVDLSVVFFVPILFQDINLSLSKPKVTFELVFDISSELRSG